jgi:hypothetical protein
MIAVQKENLATWQDAAPTIRQRVNHLRNINHRLADKRCRARWLKTGELRVHRGRRNIQRRLCGQLRRMNRLMRSCRNTNHQRDQLRTKDLTLVLTRTMSLEYFVQMLGRQQPFQARPHHHCCRTSDQSIDPTPTMATSLAPTCDKSLSSCGL